MTIETSICNPFGGSFPAVFGKQPRLESVFGPISEEEDTEIRAVCGEVDRMVLVLANHVGDSSFEKRGGLCLELSSMGQATIRAYTVGIARFESDCAKVVVDNGMAITFEVELGPGWNHLGRRTGRREWIIEATIAVDGDGGEEVVHSLPDVTALTPMEATLALRGSSGKLLALAQKDSLEKWARLASGFGS